MFKTRSSEGVVMASTGAQRKQAVEEFLNSWIGMEIGDPADLGNIISKPDFVAVMRDLRDLKAMSNGVMWVMVCNVALEHVERIEEAWYSYHAVSSDKTSWEDSTRRDHIKMVKHSVWVAYRDLVRVA